MDTIPLSQVLADNPQLIGHLHFACVAQASLPAGMPAAINPANGQLVKADAAYKPFAFVRGVLTEDVATGFSGDVAVFRQSLPDWTPVVGTQFLLPGQTYFLNIGGGMSTVPPPSGACVTVVGTALDQTTFQVNPQPPIQTW